MVSLTSAYCNESDVSVALRVINVLLKQGIPCNYLCKYYKGFADESTLCPGLKFNRNRCAEAILISCKEDPTILERLERQNVVMRVCQN